MVDKDKHLENEYILLDDQLAFHEAFELAALMLRIDDYKLFSNSADLLDYMPPEGVAKPKWYFIDWNLVGSKIQKYDLLVELRTKLGPDVGIYVMSTSDNEQEMELAKEAGCNGWIWKMYIEEVLEKWQNERDDNKDFKVWKN